MVLVTVAYTATDNCSPLAPQLSVMSGDERRWSTHIMFFSNAVVDAEATETTTRTTIMMPGAACL